MEADKGWESTEARAQCSINDEYTRRHDNSIFRVSEVIHDCETC